MDQGASVNSIDVLGQTLTIEYIKGFKEDEEAAASYYHHQKLIKVDADLKGDDLNQALLHEIFHAWEKITGLEEGLEKGQSEAIAEGFTQELMRIADIKWKKTRKKRS